MAEQENVNVQDTQEVERKYTDADVDEIINKKFAKWKSDQDKAIKEAVAEVEEAHRVAQMDEKQKRDHEYEIMEKKLQGLEAEKRHNAMMGEARSMLKADNISIADDILSVLVTDDAETTKNAVTAFSAMFQNAVNEAVKAQLADTEPRRGSAPGMYTSKEEILAIKDRHTRLKAIEDNIELFNGGK